jgi:hypothetical protein
MRKVQRTTLRGNGAPRAAEALDEAVTAYRRARDRDDEAAALRLAAATKALALCAAAAFAEANRTLRARPVRLAGVPVAGLDGSPVADALAELAEAATVAA